MTRTEKPIGIQLEVAPMPFHLSSRRIATEVAEHPEKILISELEKKKYEKILQLLAHPELNEAIQAGNFTLGIIKAQADQSKGMPEDDEHAAQSLLQEVKSRGINVVFAVNLQLSKEEAERFYAEHKGKPFFEGLINFTISGPKTYMLIQDRSGEAIQNWRDEIGSTHAADTEKVPGHPERLTLRAQFRDPENPSNNVFHGSDSTKSVALEITALRDYIKKVYEQLDGKKPGFPTEEDLASRGLFNPSTDQLISIEKQDQEPASHNVRYRDSKGEHVLIYKS